MIVNYGYKDGSGEYYIVIDTDKCDGCGKCLEACPKNVLELAEDDYGDIVVKVKDEVKSKVSYVCLGFKPGCSKNELNCRSACERDAISHTW
jgi:ferredoxin